MNKGHETLRRALNLSLAIYRLTEQLSRGEVLVYQIRKLANEVVGDLVLDDFKKTQKKIELLLIYFEIGRAQNWVREINWQVLKNEYGLLSQETELFSQVGERRDKKKPKEKEKRPDTMSHNIEKAQRVFPVSFSLRQKKIINELKSHDTLKMADLARLFKDSASERTIRNDLHDLIEKKAVSKSGARKSTIYFLE